MRKDVEKRTTGFEEILGVGVTWNADLNWAPFLTPFMLIWNTLSQEGQPTVNKGSAKKPGLIEEVSLDFLTYTVVINRPAAPAVEVLNQSFI